MRRILAGILVLLLLAVLQLVAAPAPRCEGCAPMPAFDSPGRAADPLHPR